MLPYALRVQVVAYTAGPGVPNTIARTTMNYRIDLIGQTSYVHTKPVRNFLYFDNILHVPSLEFAREKEKV